MFIHNLTKCSILLIIIFIYIIAVNKVITCRQHIITHVENIHSIARSFQLEDTHITLIIRRKSNSRILLFILITDSQFEFSDGWRNSNEYLPEIMFAFIQQC